MIRPPRSRRVYAVLTAAAMLAPAGAAHAQTRGLPVFFDPTDSYDGRVGIDVGHAGETGGTAAALTGGKLFMSGGCRRYGVSGGTGVVNPGGGGFHAYPMAGAAGSVLLGRCDPMTVSLVTVRVFAGAGAVRLDDRTVADVPVGVGVGRVIPFPAVSLQVWATPRVHYRQSLARPGDSRWDFAVSSGLTFGSGAALGQGFGGRVAVDCCRGGLGVGYGLSLWF